MSANVVNQTLTNYARGFAQDKASALAEFIAPTVAVGTATGKYKSFNDKNAFQVVDTSRAVGGEAKRLEFQSSDPSFNCSAQALEIAIDDQERDEAGEGDPIGLEKAKTETLITSATISHENKVFAAIKAGVSAVGSRGNWSSDSVDPIKELDEQIQAIADATGMLPNGLVLGIGAWRMLRDNAKVLARQPGSANIGITLAQLGAMLLNPSVEIRVGVLSKDTAKTGAAASKSNIVGDEAFLFIRSASPTLYDPSFAKTFRTRRGGVDAVYTYRAPRNRSDILAVDWSEDIQVVSTLGAKRLSIT